MTLGMKLQSLRNAKGLSQERLADSVGVSRQAVAKWESGASRPEIENLVAMSDFFGVSVDRLVRDGDQCVSILPAPSGAPVDGLQDFLCRAKKATYAGHGAEDSPSRPASHDLRYAEGDLLYLDSYLGGESFAGEEAIWREGQPVWAMNYAGRLLGEGFSGDFLKECLSLVEPSSPFRGPALHCRGDFAYRCRVEGSFGWFSGSEEIYLRGLMVYECVFHGGAVS
jgi:transcriptional regulator with XRE-family HTH domain